MQLINLLIRNKYRPELLRRCLDSIDYPNVIVIIACDSKAAFEDAIQAFREVLRPKGIIDVVIFRVNPFKSKSHYWNLYCNTLKDQVKEGFFFFLDNDDTLCPGSLLQLSTHLTEETDGIICQFLRNGKPKPNDKLINARSIQKGRIGGGCLVLHSKHKDVDNWDGEVAADYRWIKKVSEKVNLKFIPLVLQIAGNSGLHGK